MTEQSIKTLRAVIRVLRESGAYHSLTAEEQEQVNNWEHFLRTGFKKPAAAERETVAEMVDRVLKTDSAEKRRRS